MPPISKKLAAALDALRDQIIAAEAMLSKMPQPVYDDDQIWAGDFEGEPVSYICFRDGEESEVLRIRNHQSVPVIELPIEERFACAKHIPELIREFVLFRDRRLADLEEMPNEISALASEIQSAIDDIN